MPQGMIHLEDNKPGLRIELWLPTVEQFNSRHGKSAAKPDPELDKPHALPTAHQPS